MVRDLLQEDATGHLGELGTLLRTMVTSYESAEDLLRSPYFGGINDLCNQYMS